MWDIVENKYKHEYGPLIEEYKNSVNLREVILLGRGGYGMWVAGELLSAALISSGKFAKSIFVMSMDRRNSPTRSFVRFADAPVTFPSSHVYQPDDMVIADSSLLGFQSAVFDIDIPQWLGKLDANGICVGCVVSACSVSIAVPGVLLAAVVSS